MDIYNDFIYHLGILHSRPIHLNPLQITSPLKKLQNMRLLAEQIPIRLNARLGFLSFMNSSAGTTCLVGVAVSMGLCYAVAVCMQDWSFRSHVKQ